MKTSSLQLPSLAGTLSIKSMLQSAPKHVIFILKKFKNFLGGDTVPFPDPSGIHPLGWALDRVLNSTCQPWGAVSLSGVTSQRHSAARLSRRDILYFLIVTLTFDLILMGERGIMMDYLCAKFGDFSFSRFGFIVRTDRITEADDQYTHATTVGENNDIFRYSDTDWECYNEQLSDRITINK